MADILKSDAGKKALTEARKQEKGGLAEVEKQLGLTAEDIEHLHKGYAGLIALMERIPTRWAWAAEPPHVFRADE